MHNRFDYRLRLVRTARQQDIKAAARLFQTTVPTVRKWLRRCTVLLEPLSDRLLVPS